MIIEIEITDNSEVILDETKEAGIRALLKCGLTAEEYAKKLCKPDTGALRNSITHAVVEDEMAAYVGTNSEYGVYVEMGTGKYIGGGRPTPWVYQDANGNWHRTSGQPAKPYIKPAVADHVSTYQSIIKSELKG